MFDHVPADVIERAAKIRLLICDVDGVMTDGRLYFTPEGQEFKSFHARDGYGIKLLQQTGVATAVISGRNSPAVGLRMNSLGITHIYQGRENKLEPFAELLDMLGLEPEQTAFVADDLLDLPLFGRVGFAIAVADAHFSLQGSAHWTTRQPGGMGAVRETCDIIMHAQNNLKAVIERHY